MAKPSPYKQDSITVLHQAQRFGGESVAPHATVYEASIAEKVRRSPRWFSKTPASVSLDRRLSGEAVKVYDVMGLKTKNGTCTVGVRYLGRILGKDSSTVSRQIQELVEAGHLEPMERGTGQRASYRFTSPAYQRVCRECHHFAHVRESGLCWVCEALQTQRKASTA